MEKLEKINRWVDRIESNAYYRLVKIVLPLLAIFGLGYAVWDNYDSNKQSERIVKQISTQFVENFPNQIPVIADNIREAERDIIIAVDHPAYGAFSNPEGFIDLQDQIKRKFNMRENANFLSLHMICYNETRRYNELMKQFGVGEVNLNDSLFFENYMIHDLELQKNMEEKIKSIYNSSWH